MEDNRPKVKYQPWKERDFETAEAVKYDMTAIQRWMYRTLLQQAWVCPVRPYLPNDNTRLWRLAGCDSIEQWLESSGPILSCFSVGILGSEEVLIHPVLVNDWETALEKSGKMSERGRRAAAASLAARGLTPKTATPVETPVVVEKPVAAVEKTDESEDDVVNAKKQIRVLCRSLLGLAPDPDSFSSWRDLRELLEAFEPYEVVDAFKVWAADQDAGDMAARSKYPVQEFVRVATGLCSGQIKAARDPRLEGLIVDLVTIGGGEVSFDVDQARQVGKLLSKYEPSEILSAFRTFFGQVQDDPFRLKTAAKKFPEQAGQLIEYDRRVKEQEIASRRQAEEQQANLQKAALREMESRREADQKEAELIEDEL